MKTITLIGALIIMAAGFSACSEEEESFSPSQLQGEYTGIFLRSAPNARYKPAKVGITFRSDMFTGSSSERNYPAICEGTYIVSGDSIAFQNACMFTADFDWRLILDGTFSLEREGEEIIIKRSYQDEVEDRYRLTKKE